MEITNEDYYIIYLDEKTKYKFIKKLKKKKWK